MSLELDTDFRSVVFAHIQRLSGSSGGYATSAQLSEGVQFRGQRQPVWNIQQGIYRPAFLRSPGAALSIQTSFNSPYDDRHDLNDDRIAYKYRGEDTQVRMLEQHGWYLVRTKGSHAQYKHAQRRGVVTIPGRPNDDLARGTLNSILRQAGLK